MSHKPKSGAALGEQTAYTQPTSQGAQPVAAPSGAWLVAFAGGLPVERELQRGHSVVVGRSRDADVVLTDSSISRLHARVTLSHDVVVEDLGSRNGTRARGAPIPKNAPVSLAWGEPFTLGKVVCVVRSATTAEVRADAGDDAHADTDGDGDARGRLDDLVQLVASSDISVVLHGETGTGKEVLARRIHALSRRAQAPFVGLNCAAVPENLLESELFGHERGAFSGADRAKPGLFETAEGGTLFLDEVAELDKAVQAKLLRVVEERQVQRLGALKPRAIDVRFVCASHADLEERVRDGSFREDLWYRLNGLTVDIPPLRERQGEIETLARHFLHEAAERAGRAPPTLPAALVALLRAHPWPGNIRELKNVMERALLLCAGADTLSAAHLRLDLKRPKATATPAAAPTAGPSGPGSARRSRDDDEPARILAALQEAGGNQHKAAELLGISRRTLINRLDEYGLPRPRKG